MFTHPSQVPHCQCAVLCIGRRLIMHHAQQLFPSEHFQARLVRQDRHSNIVVPNLTSASTGSVRLIVSIQLR